MDSLHILPLTACTVCTPLYPTDLVAVLSVTARITNNNHQPTNSSHPFVQHSRVLYSTVPSISNSPTHSTPKPATKQPPTQSHKPTTHSQPSQAIQTQHSVSTPTRQPLFVSPFPPDCSFPTPGNCRLLAIGLVRRSHADRLGGGG